MAARERGQRAVLVNRGSALLTSSATLITLVVSGATLANALGLLRALPETVIFPVRVALCLLVFAAIIGTILTLPSHEEDLEPPVVNENKARWFVEPIPPDEIRQNYLARRSAFLTQRKKNSRRAWLLFSAVTSQLCAVVALTVAAWTAVN